MTYNMTIHIQGVAKVDNREAAATPKKIFWAEDKGNIEINNTILPQQQKSKH